MTAATCLAGGLLATLLWTGLPAGADDAPPVVIHGTAVSAAGKPLPKTTLFLLDLPGSQYLPGLNEQTRVVTDDGGHFVWTLPKEFAWNVSVNGPKDSSAPACYALPADLARFPEAAPVCPCFYLTPSQMVPA